MALWNQNRKRNRLCGAFGRRCGDTRSLRRRRKIAYLVDPDPGTGESLNGGKRQGRNGNQSFHHPFPNPSYTPELVIPFFPVQQHSSYDEQD